MAFRVFRLIAGLIAGLAALYLAITGVLEIVAAADGAGDFRTPVLKVVCAVAVLGVYWYTLVAPTRVRRVIENILSIPELVKKLAFTLALLAIYRIGFHIPLPGLDQARLMEMTAQQTGTALGRVLETVAIFTGGNLTQSTLFGLGVMPYITASIIFQLLGTVVPSIERLQREGPAGRRKIQEYTRYATVGLCIIQGMFWMRTMGAYFYPEYSPGFVWTIGVLGMTTGTLFLMWLGEQIDEYGIGNGISLLIMAGIVSRMPSAVLYVVNNATLDLTGGEGQIGPIKILVLAAMFVFVVAGAILITQGQRRIPIQQARQVRGRRMTAGGRHYLPLRVNHGGVMPIIFASSLMMFPTIVFGTLNRQWNNSALTFLAREFDYGAFLYELTYVAMIFFFAYFWTTVQFKPKELADQLRDYGHFIPGLRPGRRTAEYLERVMERITYVGAAFLAVIAVIPSVISNLMGIPFFVAAFLGGTGLLITISVTLDLVQRIEAQLVMRNYGGFLGEGARIKGAYA